MDAYNVRTGNPDLKPEYIDSYEIGCQTYFGKNSFSTEAYYRVTNNKIERVRSIYDENITLHSIENVGTDYALGSEIMLNLEYLRWWNINLMGNIYKYRVEGVLYDDSFSRESFNWNTRLNNTFKLGKSTRIQINGRYNSPRISSQGSYEGYFTTNLAIRQELLRKSLSATLQLSDIFSTARFEYTYEGKDFYTHSNFERKSPVVMLNISYNFNNHKKERQRRSSQDELEDEEF